VTHSRQQNPHKSCW